MAQSGAVLNLSSTTGLNSAPYKIFEAYCSEGKIDYFGLYNEIAREMEME